MPAPSTELPVDRLSRLPAEVSCRIYLQMDSLESVWALMWTSRRMWHIFHLCPVRVVAEVLANGTPNQVLTVIREVFNLRAGGKKALSLENMRYIDRWIEGREFNSSVSPVFVRNFIKLSRKIHGIAHVILDDCLTNLKNIKRQLHPYPMLFADIDNRRRVTPEPFLGPPSWGEEMRLVQGLWMCEFHKLIMQAEQAGSPPWVSEELAKLEQRTDAVLERFFRNGWGGTLWTIFRGIGVMELPLEHIGAPYGSLTVIPDTMDLAGPIRPGGLDKALVCERQRPAVHPDDLERLTRELSPDTAGYRYLFDDDTSLAPEGAGLLKLPVCEYASLGLMHWSSERMHGLGFSYKGDHRIAAAWRPRVYDYWLSILPEGLVQTWISIQRAHRQ